MKPQTHRPIVHSQVGNCQGFEVIIMKEMPVAAGIVHANFLDRVIFEAVVVLRVKSLKILKIGNYTFLKHIKPVHLR